MVECSRRCICARACELIGCIYDHPLVNESNVGLFFTPIRKLKLSKVVQIFQIIEPPKISGKQIRKYNEAEKEKQLIESGLLTINKTKK